MSIPLADSQGHLPLEPNICSELGCAQLWSVRRLAAARRAKAGKEMMPDDDAIGCFPQEDWI